MVCKLVVGMVLTSALLWIPADEVVVVYGDLVADQVPGRGLQQRYIAYG